jgi:hypothetical protein
MKFEKQTWRTLLAGAVGFIFGMWLFYSRSVSAQTGTVNVDRVRFLTDRTSGTTSVRGTQVVGFSCFPARGGDPECYVATR